MSKTDRRDLDRSCLRRLAEGDVSALETIWEEHGDRSFRHALWVTGRREDAEDVVHTVFLRLVGMGGELIGVRDLVSYLGAMIHHEAVFVSKHRAARAGHGEPDPEALLASHPDPEQDVERREVAALVATLPADQREVVVLHLWGGLTFREIGRATGVSMFTVASRFRLATSRLRRVLKGETR